MNRSVAARTLLLIAGLLRGPNAAAQQSDADLAAAAQKPVAATYSLPFQNNTFGGAGKTHDAVGNVLNIQPVLPFTFGDWNVISRTIAPLIYVPGLVPGLPENAGVPAGTSAVFGLGVSALKRQHQVKNLFRSIGYRRTYLDKICYQ